MPSVNLNTPRSRAPRDLGPQLRGWRLEQGISQADLARLAGLSRKTIQRIESGHLLSADTAIRIERALDLPEESVAPDWSLPPSPVESDYGSRVRARRRALGMSLEELALATGVSAATVSRFERGITVPRRWFVEWIDDFGMLRDAIVAKPLAEALGFAHVGELQEFCMAGDVSRWMVAGDRRSALWLPREDPDPGVAPSRAFPTMAVLRIAHYRSGLRKN